MTNDQHVLERQQWLWGYCYSHLSGFIFTDEINHSFVHVMAGKCHCMFCLAMCLSYEHLPLPVLVVAERKLVSSRVLAGDVLGISITLAVRCWMFVSVCVLDTCMQFPLVLQPDFFSSVATVIYLKKDNCLYQVGWRHC